MGTLVHAWTGIPDGSSIPLTVKTSGATTVAVKYGTDAAITQGVVTTASVAPDSAGYADFSLTGLTADEYWYAPVIDGAVSSSVGHFKPDPGFGTQFKIAFGSCLESGSSNSTAFNNLLTKSPNLFLHLGDFHYDDNVSTSAASHRASMENQITGNTGLRTVLRQVPTAYTLSDHDSGSNDWSGGPKAWTVPVNQALSQVVPYKPATTDFSGHYWSFVYGGVRVIMLDCHSFKSTISNSDGTSHTMLGSIQKAWLKDQLSKPELVKVIATDVPWISNLALSRGGNSWGGFATERSEIANYITANKINAVIVHGDSHSLVGDDGTNSVGKIPVFGAAPFDKSASVKGGPKWTSGPWPNSGYTTTSDGTLGSGPQSQQYGLITFTPATNGDTQTMTVAYAGYDSGNTGRVAVSKTFSAASLTPDPGAGGDGTPPAPTPGTPTGVPSVTKFTKTIGASVAASLDVTLPTFTYDAAKGQYLYLACACPSTTFIAQVPTGWSEVFPGVAYSSGTTLTVFRKAATAADSGAAVSVPWSKAMDNRMALAVLVEGAAAELNGTPVTRTASSSASNANTQTLGHLPGLEFRAGSARITATNGTKVAVAKVTAGDASTPDTLEDGYAGIQIASTAGGTSRNGVLFLAWKPVTAGVDVPNTSFDLIDPSAGTAQTSAVASAAFGLGGLLTDPHGDPIPVPTDTSPQLYYVNQHGKLVGLTVAVL